MGIENVRADFMTDPVDRLVRTPLSSADQPEVRPGNPLDSELAVKTHGWLMGLFEYEKRRQAPNRMQMALDCDFYDGIQLSDDDIEDLLARGQAPLVYNLVKRTVDWVIGTEKRTRFDFKVLGRTSDDVAAARIKTDVMKYYQDVNRSHFHRSQAFREAAIAGVGWLECGARADPDEEPIYSTNESWWFTLHDSHAMKLDYLDARYHFRWRYVDLDVATAMFPERERFIVNDARNGAVIDEKMADEFYLGNRVAGEDYLAGQYSRLNSTFQGYIDSSRERVKLCEGWFKKPVREKTVLSRRLPQFHGLPYNPGNDDMRHALVIGDASIVERLNMRVFYMIFTASGVLAAGRSPYRHNEFPFTPVWCYRRGRDNAPYGIIRNIRDPQTGFNRRMSKAIFALTAYRVTASADAIDPKTQSWEDLRIEAGRPDALLVKARGSELTVEQDRALGEEHLKLAQTEGSLILDASGVTADNLGLDSNAESGKAIIAKQSEGAAVTAEIFDNLRLGCQLHGEKELSLIEQFVTEEKVMRVTDAKGRPSWKKVNEVVTNPDGSVRVLNDIVATKADFVIDQQDFRATQRQAASEALMAVMPKFGNLDPKFVMRVLRMAIDVSDWPNKEEMVKELDQMTGYKDPEAALTEEEREEQQQAEKQQIAAQEKAEQMKEAAFKAELEEKIAGAELKRAQAEKHLADADARRAETQLKIEAGAEVDTSAIDAERDQAQAAVDAANDEVERLRAELAKAQTERYRIDREAETKVRVAELQKPPPNTEGVGMQEAIADLMQDIAGLNKAVQALAQRQADPKMAQAIDQVARGLEEIRANTSGVIDRVAQAAEAAARAVDSVSRKPDEEPTVTEYELPDGRKVTARRSKQRKPDDEGGKPAP